MLFAVSVKPLVLIVGVKDVAVDASTAVLSLMTARSSVRAMVSISPGARNQPDVATFISVASSPSSAIQGHTQTGLEAALFVFRLFVVCSSAAVRDDAGRGRISQRFPWIRCSVCV